MTQPPGPSRRSSGKLRVTQRVKPSPPEIGEAHAEAGEERPVADLPLESAHSPAHPVAPPPLGNVRAMIHGARSPRLLTLITNLAATTGDVSVGAAAELLERGLGAVVALRLVDGHYRDLGGFVDSEGRIRTGAVRYIRLVAQSVRVLSHLDSDTARPLLAELHERLRVHLDDLAVRQPTTPKGHSRRWTPVADDLADADITVLLAIRRLDAAAEERRRKPSRVNAQAAEEAQERLRRSHLADVASEATA